MNERLKALRKALRMSQEEFGFKIGLKKAAISKVENGNTSPTEQTLLALCREFNVSYAWLKTGEGDMFVPLIDADGEAIGDLGVLFLNGSEFTKKTLHRVARLGREEWDALERIVDKLSKE